MQAVLRSERSLASGILLVALDLPESREEGERLPVAGARRRFLQAEETLAATFGCLVARVSLEPAGFFIELSVVGLDDFEVLNGGDAVARKVALNLVALDRVEVKVDGLRNVTINESQCSADARTREAAGTNQNVSPPAVVAEMLHDAVRILGVECRLHRVAESLSGIGRAVGVGRNSGTGREDRMLDVRNRLLESVQDPVLGMHIGRGRHCFCRCSLSVW